MHHPPHKTKHQRATRHRSAGLSLVESLVSLAIVAALLTATMVAVDASFQAYAAAAESASTQTTTRMVVHRLLNLVRTSTAHGPLQPNGAANPPVTLTGNTIESNYIELIDNQGRLVTIVYDTANQQLNYSIDPLDGSTVVTQPLLGGVTNCVFHATRRTNRDGLIVLERASIDLTVVPDADSSLAIENAEAVEVRVVASTKPRRLD